MILDILSEAYLTNPTDFLVVCLFTSFAQINSFKIRVFRSSLVAEWIKDPVLSLQQLRWLLWHGFDPWLWNFHMPWVWPKIKIKKIKLGYFLIIEFWESPPVLLRYCWQNRYTTWNSRVYPVMWLPQYVYLTPIDSQLQNFFLGMRTFKIHPFSNFHMFNRVQISPHFRMFWHHFAFTKDLHEYLFSFTERKLERCFDCMGKGEKQK